MHQIFQSGVAHETLDIGNGVGHRCRIGAYLYMRVSEFTVTLSIHSKLRGVMRARYRNQAEIRNAVVWGGIGLLGLASHGDAVVWLLV